MGASVEPAGEPQPLTGETFPQDPDEVAALLGHPGLELIADGDRGAVYFCTGDCATLWWPDVYAFPTTTEDGRWAYWVHADRYAPPCGDYCDDCRAIPPHILVDATTLTYIGPVE